MPLANIDKPKPFQFLVAEGANKSVKRTAANTVLLAYTKDQLKDKIVTWSDKSYCYYVFDTLDQLESYVENYVDKSLYEVIFGEHPQKVKFDIDQVDNEELRQICAVIKDIWAVNKFPSKEFFIFKTSGMGYHILINYVLPNVTEVKKIYDLVVGEVQKIYPELAPRIDPKVYGSTQNFRMLGCQKNGGRTMTKISLSIPKSTLKESLVRKYDWN